MESKRPRTNCVEESEDGVAVAESECPAAPVEGTRDAGAAADVNNKLTATQYEKTTWSARSWVAFASQQISVALHLAVAHGIQSALDAWGCLRVAIRGVFRRVRRHVLIVRECRPAW